MSERRNFGSNEQLQTSNTLGRWWGWTHTPENVEGGMKEGGVEYAKLCNWKTGGKRGHLVWGGKMGGERLVSKEFFVVVSP